jgi:hypothetical protein
VNREPRLEIWGEASSGCVSLLYEICHKVLYQHQFISADPVLPFVTPLTHSLTEDTRFSLIKSVLPHLQSILPFPRPRNPPPSFFKTKSPLHHIIFFRITPSPTLQDVTQFLKNISHRTSSPDPNFSLYSKKGRKEKRREEKRKGKVLVL